jgi:hypothetical protein
LHTRHGMHLNGRGKRKLARCIFNQVQRMPSSDPLLFPEHFSVIDESTCTDSITGLGGRDSETSKFSSDLPASFLSPPSLTQGTMDALRPAFDMLNAEDLTRNGLLDGGDVSLVSNRSDLN